jgi:hypothetical protein
LLMSNTSKENDTEIKVNFIKWSVDLTSTKHKLCFVEVLVLL